MRAQCHDDEPRGHEMPDEAPETPPDEPKPPPVQDPPSEPIEAPYVVTEGHGRTRELSQ
jgi:hypothetical protein